MMGDLLGSPRVAFPFFFFSEFFGGARGGLFIWVRNNSVRHPFHTISIPNHVIDIILFRTKTVVVLDKERCMSDATMPGPKHRMPPELRRQARVFLVGPAWRWERAEAGIKRRRAACMTDAIIPALKHRIPSELRS